jgi:protein associated with RNAse G/E
VAKGLAWVCDKPCYSESSVVLILMVKRNGNSSKIEIEKFNGKSFELWKLKMEVLLVDKDQCLIINSGTTPMGKSTKDWKNLDRKENIIIWLCILRFNIIECVRGSYSQGIME